MNNDWNDIKYAWKHKTFWEKCYLLVNCLWLVPFTICVSFWNIYIIGTIVAFIIK